MEESVEDRTVFAKTLNREVAGLDVDTSAEEKSYVSSREQEDLQDQNTIEIASTERVVQNVVEKEDDLVYTVEDAVNHMGFGPFQILATFFSGFIWTADAMELMLLSVLGPVLQCYWEGITDFKKAMITSVVFMGFLFGGFIWGVLADMFGRRRTLLIVDVVVLIFGLASALSPNYGLLLLFRFGTGFGIGGSAQSVTYYVEFLPRKTRGVCITLLEIWWAVGSIFAAILAMVVMPNVSDEYNWRLYLGLCTFPLAIVLLLFPFVPESARYYVTLGNIDKATKVMQRVAWWNRKALPKGRLVSQETKEQVESMRKAQSSSTELEESSFQVTLRLDDKELCNGELEQEPLLSRDEAISPVLDVISSSWRQRCASCCNKEKVTKVLTKSLRDLSTVFTGGMWKTTVLLLFIWFGCAWLYYGAVLLTTTILEKGSDPHCHRNGTSGEDCHNLTITFYEHLLWTTAAEFPGIIVTLVIIELIGRKITMAVEFGGTAVFFGLILICAGTGWTTFFLFGARGFATGVFQAVYVYTPEVYPTLARGAAMGINTASARIGAIITPFVAQVLFDLNDYLTISLYAGSCLVLIVLALLLPIETKGRSLKDLKA